MQINIPKIVLKWNNPQKAINYYYKRARTYPAIISTQWRIFFANIKRNKTLLILHLGKGKGNNHRGHKVRDKVQDKPSGHEKE